MPDSDGWKEHALHVLKELERLNDTLLQMQRDVSKLYTEVATLKVKAGMWGAIGAAIPVMILLLMERLP